MGKITLSPSIMCADLVNLEQSIQVLEKEGLDALHIDVIDASFSPSMPLGLETIKRMREVTSLPFDVHIMSNNNEYFIQEMLKIGVQSVTFHVETSLHIDRYINLIHQADAKAAVALNPATSLSALDYILPELDMVCLMLINPGFATDKGEKQVQYAIKKIQDLREKIKDCNAATSIQVDGRVSIERIPELVRAGADNLVLGSTSLFISGRSISENKVSVLEAIEEGRN